ncbi:MAG: hypothetical protein ACLQQ0_09965 [Limisphaerales bacterium]
MSQEEPAAGTSRPAPSREPGGRRRGRRGGRGRGPRRSAPIPQTDQSLGAPVEGAPVPEPRPASPPAPLPPQPASSAINQAVDEVMAIVEALKQALGQMEDVLELVEHAERQKLADEHEIDSLRRLLRQLQHPRSGRGERREHEV